jgi:glycosyltransferase involved in cell wall biosynthesis
MRVVHIAYSDYCGGADRSAVNLHNGLLGIGVDSIMLVDSSSGKNNSVVEAKQIPISWRKQVESLLVWDNRTDISNSHFSLNMPGGIELNNDILCDADIINLHWVTGMLSAASICHLVKLRKPIIWTLHDLRPLTGGCHFPAKCDKYKSSCTDCPQLAQDSQGMIEQGRMDLSIAAHLGSIHYVAPSTWMRDAIKSSATAKGCLYSHIPYGVDDLKFSPGATTDARKLLGLKEEALYILLASNDVLERRKGFLEAVEILKDLKKDAVFSGRIESGKIRILVCGKRSDQIEIPGWSVDSVGYLTEDSMPLLYQSADVLLFTSIEDNLPNVLLEAMACGLPLVAHDLPGVRDLLGEEENSDAIIQIGSAINGSKILGRILNSNEERKQISLNIRSRICKRFKICYQALEYKKLYSNLIHNYNINNEYRNTVTIEKEYNTIIESLLCRIRFEANMQNKLNKTIQDQSVYILELERACEERLKVINQLEEHRIEIETKLNLCLEKNCNL